MREKQEKSLGKRLLIKRYGGSCRRAWHGRKHAVYCAWAFDAGVPGLAGLAAMALLPSMLCFAGLGLWLGLWLGRVHPNLVYALVAFLFFSAFIQLRLPVAADLLGNSALGEAALALPKDGIIPFVLPRGYLASRIGLAAAGLLLCAARVARAR